MPNALVFSPGFDGHRQVYVFVITHILKELGYKIYIAGNTKQIISNSFFLKKIKMYKGTEIIDTSNYKEGGIKISRTEFINLQNKYNIDLTIFAEADHHISLLNSQLFLRKKKFRGKLVGLFLRPFYYYENLGYLDKLRYLKHMPSRWKNDDRLFHEILLRRFALLDVALYLDEHFVAKHKFGTWVPDVFQEYADSLLQKEGIDNKSWINKLEEFKQKNAGKFMFLYFGTAQFRRGYDILLKLAVDSQGCFIHCGLRNNKERYSHDVEKFRSLLRNYGRLFETDEFIEDPVCIEYFFRSVSHLVLPYRHFYGSSGVMLQALNFGIPVMAPENGIIGYRIKKYNLGITYNDEKDKNLKSKFDFFRSLEPKTFENDIKSYMNYQNPNKLRKALIQSFNSAGQSLLHPVLQKI